MAAFLELDSVDKTFDGNVEALQKVSLSVARGSVHALIGENGAGKSTLAGILAGHYAFDGGSIRLAGASYRPRSPRDAAARGVGLVHQHFMLFPSLTVAENVVLGSEPIRRGTIDRRRAEGEVAELGARYGLEVDPRRLVGDLSLGERQRVEILKALHLAVELVIFDEPTAVLTPEEARGLFKAMRKLVAGGHTVILIAHKLEEVLSVADQVTVLRQGRVVGTRSAGSASREELVRMMVGEAPAALTDPEYGRAGEELLALRRLALPWHAGRLASAEFSLSVAAGEIVGVAGMAGNGQLQFEQVLAGLLEPVRGAVLLRDPATGNMRPITALNPRQRRALGLAYVPSDRLAWGSSPSASVFENAISHSYRLHSRYGFLHRRRLAAWTRELLERFDVRTPGLHAPLRTLSGGNVQKLILGRELTGAAPQGQLGEAAAPLALVVAMPTRGIDVRGVAFIHDLLRRYRDAGCAILLISTDLDEIVALADRIAILSRGTIAQLLPGRGRTGKEELGRHMLRGAEAAA